MALKPNQLKSLNTLSMDLRLLLTPSLALLIIPALFIVAFGAALSFAPTTSTLNPNQLTSTQAQFSMKTSGALTLYLNNADVTCTTNTLNFAVPAVNGANGYQLSFATPANLMQPNQATAIDLNATNQLKLSLVDLQQLSYRSFTAQEGQLNLISQGQGTLNAFLYDAQGQQLFLNANWTCAS